MSGLPQIQLIVFLGTLLLVTGGVLFATASSRRRQYTKKIEAIRTRVRTGNRATEATLALRKKKETKSRTSIMQKLHDMMPRTRSLAGELQRANMQMSAGAFETMCAAMFLFWVVLVKVILHKPLLLGGFLGVIFGVWLPLKVVRVRIERQMRRFLKVFPDAIDLIVRGLRSGLPIAESMNMIAKEVAEPVSTVFLNVTNTMKLGVTLEKSLQETAKKLDLTEFNFFTTSVILQRETGGNLSEILNNLGDVLRKREMMRLKIKALTSEARASSVILGALPFLVLGGATVMSPDFIRPLIDDPRGNMAAFVAGGMLFTGVWVMRRMGRFEI